MSLDNIVPTSGMRGTPFSRFVKYRGDLISSLACTAVVTEIAYHKEKTIAADVSFLSENEWREELSVLLDDLVAEDGRFVLTSCFVAERAHTLIASSA